ncbi:hypothetical protein FisN_24Hh232 [Fistulifera solaris]|uniref:Uncharacterized protein n=1 Tax=Fistulifera solaris TaxID=1519565 RepID=A0A1Z5K2N4_FISSO|nr:hypothetical protein FisN_24Hh232 [Fistulifera solaris]|eukprot:GAX20517.1 hypothetical protein FisN_24Hh232 [Fistulifera solaris]
MPPREAVDERLEVVVSESPIAVRRRRLTPTPYTEYNPPFSDSKRLRRSLTGDMTTTAEWVQRCWQLHFGVSLSVLMFGYFANQPASKYIPIDPTLLVGQECERAFLNVLSSSLEDPFATVCCNAVNIHGICNKTTLPLGSRLSRFPEAWLIPLFPLILRWCVNRWNNTIQNNHTMVRRLVLYITMMLIRGVILYRGMNQMENYFHSTDASCWYQEYLREDQATCYGRSFDFSDHVVLYMAQILPICLAETLECLQQPPTLPPRRILSTQTMTLLTSMNGGINPDEETPPKKKCPSVRPLSVVIVFGTLYLYLITLWGSYRTTAYFHTGPEVFMGFAVSLLLQWPLYRLQCSEQPFLRYVQDWFFGK